MRSIANRSDLWKSISPAKAIQWIYDQINPAWLHRAADPEQASWYFNNIRNYGVWGASANLRISSWIQNCREALTTWYQTDLASHPVAQYHLSQMADVSKDEIKVALAEGLGTDIAEAALSGGIKPEQLPKLLGQDNRRKMRKTSLLLRMTQGVPEIPEVTLLAIERLWQELNSLASTCENKHLSQIDDTELDDAHQPMLSCTPNSV